MRRVRQQAAWDAFGAPHAGVIRFSHISMQRTFYMSAKTKLKRALNAIDDAQRALNRARNTSPDSQDIRRALRELDDAESEIRRAIRDVD